MAKCEESHIAHYLSVIVRKKIYRIKKVAQSRAISHFNATSCLYHVCRVFNKSKTYLPESTQAFNFFLKV